MKFADLLHVDLKQLSQQELAPVEVAVLDTGVDASHPDLLRALSRKQQREHDAIPRRSR